MYWTRSTRPARLRRPYVERVTWALPPYRAGPLRVFLPKRRWPSRRLRVRRSERSRGREATMSGSVSAKWSRKSRRTCLVGPSKAYSCSRFSSNVVISPLLPLMFSA